MNNTKTSQRFGTRENHSFLGISLLVKFVFIATFLFSANFSFAYTVVDQDYLYGSEIVQELEEFYQDQLIRKAEYKLLEHLKSDITPPTYDKALILQSNIDILSGNYTIADGRLEEFITKRDNSPFVPFAAYLRALIAFENENYEFSSNLFDFALKKSEEDLKERKDSVYYEIAHNSIFFKGLSFVRQGRYAQAETIFNQLLEKYPLGEYSDDAIFHIAKINELNREYQLAIDEFKRLLSNYPQSDLLLISNIRIANNSLILRNPSQALQNLSTAERILNTDDSQQFMEKAPEMILYLRGESQNLAGNYDKAIEYFNEYEKLYPQSIFINSVYNSTGWAYLNKENPNKAIEYFEKVIFSEEPEFREKSIAQLYRTVALKRRGDKDQARKELSALVVQPTYPYLGQALLEIGQIYYEDGEFEQARRTLERADRETLDAKIGVRVNLLLGATYLEIGLWELAVQEYKKAEQLAKNSSETFMPNKNWYIKESLLKQGIALVKSLRSREAIKPLTEFISAGKSVEREDIALFWMAEAYYSSDMLQNAIETYSKLLDLHPQTVRREDALYGLGWTYFRMQNFDNSTRVFNQMINEYPKSKYNIEVLTRQGDGYYLKKDYRRASEFYQRAARTAPGTEEGQYSAYQLSHSLYRQGAYERAITSSLDFYKMYNKSPYAPNTLYLVGWIKFQQNKFSEAIDNFKFLLSAYPQSNLIPRTHYAIGDAYFNLSEYQTAIESYKIVVEEYPSSSLAPEAFRSIQFCLMALGREDEAIEILDNYISSNDESPFVEEFRFKKGEMFYQGRKYNDAISEYDNFLSQHPESEKAAEVLFWKAKSYANLNETDKAFGTYKQLHKGYPNSDYAPLAILEEAILHMEMANIDQAEKQFLYLENTYPKHPSAAQAGYERAMISYIIGDTSKAITLLTEVSDKYQNTDFGDQSRYRVAMYFRNVGDYEKSRFHFAIIANVEDNPVISAESQYRIGELWVRDENHLMAIEAFKLVKENFSGVEDWYSLSLLGLGESYEALEEYESAKEVYNDLKEWRPDDDFGKTAETRLKRIKNK